MQQHRILHIEDSKTDADLIKRTLQKSELSFQYLLAVNEDEVHRGLEEFLPDLVLCDHSLPSFNSKMAYAICKENNPELPFILVTGTVSEEFAVDMIQTGVDDYLLKSNLQRLPIAIKKAYLKKQNEKEVQLFRTELHQSESRLRTIFESSPAGLLLLDRDGIILELNDRTHFYSMVCFGCDLEKNESLLKSIPEQRRHELEAKIEKSLRGEKIQFEAVYPQQDGPEMTFNVVLSPTVNSEGVASGICMTLEDITQRRKAEEDIKNNERQLNVIYNTVSDSFFMLNIEEQNRFKFISVNSTFLKTTGLSEEKVIGKYIHDVIPSPSLELVVKKYSEAITSKAPVSWEEITVFPSGIKTGLVTISPVIDEKNNCTMLVGSVHDITEVKRVDNEMKSLTNRLRLATQSAKMGIWHWDLETNKLEADELMYKLYGVDAADFNAEYDGWFSIIHNEDSQRLANELQLAITNQKDYDTEFRIVWADSSIHYIRATGIVERDNNGKAIRMIGSNWDVTEEKESAIALEKSEREFRSLAESMPQIVWTTRADGWNTYFNQNWSDYTGLTLEESSGDGWNKPFHPDDQQRAWDTWQNAVNNKGDYFLECRLRKYDGTYRWWLIRGTPHLDDNGEILKWFGTCTDIDQIKQSEEVIKKEKALSDSVINSLPGVFYLFDDTGKFLRWNKEFEKITGYSAEEIATMKTGQFFRDDDRKLISKSINEAFSEGATSAEAHFLTKDNREIPFYFTGTLTTYAEKPCIVGVAVDITERKNAAKEMESLSNRLQLATTSAGMGIWDWNLKNNELLWDEKMYQLYGIVASEFSSLYEGWFLRLYEEDKERVAHEVELAITDKKDYDTEFRVVWADSSIHYIRATGIVERDAKGKPQRMIGANWDVTSQKEKEQHLTLLESVITNTSDAVLITEAEPFDEPGPRILFVNEAFTEMTGYTAEEVIGKTPRILQGPKSDRQELKKLGEAIRQWQPFETSIINYKKNGEEFWNNFLITPVTNETGFCSHWIAIERDVTERKLIEINLKQLNEDLNDHVKKLALSNDELEHFAFVASHDLQEPLRMVTNFLTQLERKYGDVLDDKAKKYIEFAVDGAKRMRQIILDLLEFSRVGKALETENLLDLNEVCSDIKVLLKKKVAEKKAILVIDNLPKIYADISPIRQVFQNLIANALEYSNKDVPAQIHISAKETGDFWQFAVADNGIGISKEYYEKIFVIFQRLHSKEEHAGTGLGLAITKKIIEGHGGKIWVESEEGKGSTFYFTIKK